MDIIKPYCQIVPKNSLHFPLQPTKLKQLRTLWSSLIFGATIHLNKPPYKNQQNTCSFCSKSTKSVLFISSSQYGQNIFNNNIYSKSTTFSHAMKFSTQSTDRKTTEAAEAYYPSRRQLLANVENFWARQRLRFKLLLMGRVRPWKIDDFLALFSWLFVGNTVFILAGTTTFTSLILALANSLQFQGKEKITKIIK